MGAPEEEFREPSPGFSELMGKWGQRDKEAEQSKPYFARIGKSLSSGSDTSSTPDRTSATDGTTVHRFSAPATYRKPTRQQNPMPVVCSPTQLKKKALIDTSEKTNNSEMFDVAPPRLLDMSEDELDTEAAAAVSEPVNSSTELAIESVSGSMQGLLAEGKVSHTWSNLLRTSKQVALAKRKIKQKRAKLNNVFASKLDDDTPFVPPVFAKSLIESKMLQIAMKSNFVFRKLDNLTLDTLATAFEQVEFNAGETIIKQGDRGDFFYAVKHGEVDFWVDQVKVGSARTGKSFGELALLYTCLRAATVKASSSIPKTTLFRIDQKCFRHVLKIQVEDSEKVKLQLLRKIKAFQKVDTNDLKVMVPTMEPQIFEKGDVVWTKESGTSQRFFVVQEGELSFTRRKVDGKTEKDKKLGPGDYFGSLSSGQNDPIEEGTVTALSRVLAFSIDRDLLEQDLGGVKRLVNKSVDKSNLVRIGVLTMRPWQCFPGLHQNFLILSLPRFLPIVVDGICHKGEYHRRWIEYIGGSRG
jgi:cAMP-dependent protein kinase regulator